MPQQLREQSFYERLQVGPLATLAEIEAAHLQVTGRLRPHHDQEKLQLINEAFTVLRDERRRRHYDQELTSVQAAVLIKRVDQAVWADDYAAASELVKQAYILQPNSARVKYYKLRVEGRPQAGLASGALPVDGPGDAERGANDAYWRTCSEILQLIRRGEMVAAAKQRDEAEALLPGGRELLWLSAQIVLEAGPERRDEAETERVRTKTGGEELTPLGALWLPVLFLLLIIAGPVVATVLALVFWQDAAGVVILIGLSVWLVALTIRFK